MCLRFVFLLITNVVSWLRLSRREETWKTAEILILRHQLAVLQRRQPRRPNLTWADRALLATLLSVIPKARRQGLRLRAVRLVREHAGDYPSEFAAMKAVAARLGIGTAETLRKWVRQAEIDQGQAPGVTTAEAAQVRELKRKVAELEATLMILVEATRFFAREGDPLRR